VLEQYSLHAHQLSEAKITLRRPAPNGKGEERVLPIACDPSTGLISAETNHPLLPGDRIFVTPPKPKRTRFSPSEAVMPSQYYDSNPPSTAVAAPPEPQTNLPASPADGAVAYKIIILDDPNGRLTEFESLRDRFMLDETGTTRDALRVLEKNGLIKCVSSPQLTSRLGESCQMKMNSPAVNKDEVSQSDVAVQVSAREVGDHLLVEIQMDRREAGVKTSIDMNVDMKSGQTVILANGPPANSEDEAAKRRTYLVLTPTLVE
jgi:hypothetical protein